MIFAVFGEHDIFGVTPTPDTELWPGSCHEDVDVFWVVIVTDNQIPMVEHAEANLDICPKISFFEVVHRWHEVFAASFCHNHLAHRAFNVRSDQAFLCHLKLFIGLSVVGLRFVMPDDSDIATVQHLRQGERYPYPTAILSKHFPCPVWSSHTGRSKACDAARRSAF